MSALIGGREGVGRKKGRNLEICNDFDDLEEVVEGDDGVEEHEEGLRNLEDIVHLAGCPRLEVADAVVANIANSASCEGWKCEAWDDRLSVL